MAGCPISAKVLYLFAGLACLFIGVVQILNDERDAPIGRIIGVFRHAGKRIGETADLRHLQCIYRPETEILHADGLDAVVFAKMPVWRGFQAVEGFSTLVPFSIYRSPTNVTSEQFWGRAARAFLTRKGQDACFIFRSFFRYLF